MKAAAITVAMAFAVSTLSTFAENAGGPPPGGGGQVGGPQRGFHILPPRAQEQLNLTADQQKKISDLEAEVKTKLEKILTPEQMEQLKQMRPPQRQGGPGGGGQGGQQPGGGQGQPNRQRPPSE